MIFTNNQKNTILQVPIPHNYTGAFSSRYLRAHPPSLPTNNPAVSQRVPSQYTLYETAAALPRQVVSQTVTTPGNTAEISQHKPMKWGEPTWFMFHTIAEKIKPEYYLQYRSEILNIIRIVCNTLPCPICANHASQYMQNINELQLHTKEDLQRLLWTFHNSVNERKGQPFFKNENGQLHAKYSRANTRAIIQQFIRVHSDKHSGFRMMADDFYRNKNIHMIKTWFIRNISIFDN